VWVRSDLDRAGARAAGWIPQQARVIWLRFVVRLPAKQHQSPGALAIDSWDHMA